MEKTELWLKDGRYKINCPQKIFYDNCKNGTDYMRATNLIVPDPIS